MIQEHTTSSSCDPLHGRKTVMYLSQDTEHPASYTPHRISAAWVAMRDLIDEWGEFSDRAETPAELLAVSEVFAARAWEREALRLYIKHWHRSPAAEPEPFAETVLALHAAWKHWHQALGQLAELADGEPEECISQVFRSLHLKVLGQRVRVARLLCEVEHEHLQAWQPSHPPATGSPPPTSEQKEGTQESERGSLP